MLVDFESLFAGIFDLGRPCRMTAGKPVANEFWQGRRGPDTGTDVPGYFVGERINIVEFHFMQQPHD
jgi:hypothetical protein